MNEQAAILSQATSGLLVGDVEQLQSQGKQNIVLRVVAPCLDNYRYSILLVTHNIKLYPLRLDNLANDSHEKQCDSEKAFEQALGEVLSSPEVRKVISALLSEYLRK